MDKKEHIILAMTTFIYLSKSHGTNFQEAKQIAEEILKQNKTNFNKLRFYERLSLVKGLLKNNGITQ
jgi:hypothetical protein